MKLTLTLATVVAISSTLVAADGPTGNLAGYPGIESFRLVFEGNKCMRVQDGAGDDPWFKDCYFDDPLDFDAFWRAVKVGPEYSQIQNSVSGKCLYRGRPA